MDFKEVFDEVVKASKDYATTFFKENKNDVVNEAKTVLNAHKDDLQRWINLVLEGKLTQEDMNDLVGGRIELDKMEALKLKGISIGKVDRIKAFLTDTVVTTIFKLIPS